MRRAGFWLRAAALAIDVVLASVLAHLFALAVYYYVAERGHGEPANYLYDAVTLGLVLAYTSAEVWAGRSPGKTLFGLRVGYPDGTPADRWTLFLRWCTKWFGYLVSLVSAVTLHPTLLEQLGGFMNTVILVGCLQALDEDKRAWHDEWARTAVFRRRRQASPVTIPPPLPVPPATPAG